MNWVGNFEMSMHDGPILPRFLLLFGLLLDLSAQAAQPFLCTDYYGGRVCKISLEGKVEWEYHCKNPQDCW